MISQDERKAKQKEAGAWFMDALSQLDLIKNNLFLIPAESLPWLKSLEFIIKEYKQPDADHILRTIRKQRLKKRPNLRLLGEYFIKVHVVINDAPSHLDMKLLWKSHMGAAQDVENLLVRGASIDAQNSAGETPLLKAIRGNHQEVFDVLLKHQANVHTSNNNGIAPIHLAVKNPQWTRRLIKLGADVNQLSKIGAPPFSHLTTSLKMAEISPPSACETASLLIENGADINRRDQRRLLPIHYALSSGNADLVNMLLQKDSKAGLIALWICLSHNRAALPNLLSHQVKRFCTFPGRTLDSIANRIGSWKKER